MVKAEERKCIISYGVMIHGVTTHMAYWYLGLASLGAQYSLSEKIIVKAETKISVLI